MTIGEKLRIPALSDMDGYQVLEITLPEDDDFLKVIETLTRIGISSKKEKKLTQSVHILHKQGRYYLMHFLEMFALSNRQNNITQEDIKRRNLIAKLLQEWGLVEVVDKEILSDCAHTSSIRVIPFKEKHEWTLSQKYTMTADRKKKDEIKNEQ